MTHAMIAGIEIALVDSNKTLSINIVSEQNMTVGDVSEWLYRGKNSMIKVKTSRTDRKKNHQEKKSKQKMN